MVEPWAAIGAGAIGGIMYFGWEHLVLHVMKVRTAASAACVASFLDAPAGPGVASSLQHDWRMPALAPHQYISLRLTAATLVF